MLLRHLLLGLLTVVVLVPFAWILVSSLKTLPEFFRFPPSSGRRHPRWTTTCTC